MPQMAAPSSCGGATRRDAGAALLVLALSYGANFLLHNAMCRRAASSRAANARGRRPPRPPRPGSFDQVPPCSGAAAYCRHPSESGGDTVTCTTQQGRAVRGVSRRRPRPGRRRGCRLRAWSRRRSGRGGRDPRSAWSTRGPCSTSIRLATGARGGGSPPKPPRAASAWATACVAVGFAFKLATGYPAFFVKL